MIGLPPGWTPRQLTTICAVDNALDRLLVCRVSNDDAELVGGAELRCIAHESGDFVAVLERQSREVLAGRAGRAEHGDLHRREVLVCWSAMHLMFQEEMFFCHF